MEEENWLIYLKNNKPAMYEAAKEYLNSESEYQHTKIEVLSGMVTHSIFILDGIQSGQFNMEQAQVHAEKMRQRLYRIQSK